MRRLALSFLFLSCFAPPAFANYLMEDCFNEVVTKNAMLRKYDYKYMWGSSDTITKGQEGSSHVTSQNTTQGSTAGIDPGFSTGIMKREFMSTSSKKPCALYGQNFIERERFVAANADGLKKDIARGDGPSLQAFAVLSGCQEVVMSRYFQALRSNYDALAPLAADTGELSLAIDQISIKDDVLRAGCSI